MTDAYQIRIDRIAEWRDVEPVWTELEARASCSFFQSWAWIGTWLSRLPPDIAPSLAQVHSQESLVGLAVLCTHRFEYPLFNVDVLHINETGSLDFDRLTIEYNGLLIDGDQAETVLSRAFGALREYAAWHELRISGIDASLLSGYRQAAETSGLQCVIRDAKPCYSVQLQALRDANTEYLSALSRNTRYQIRRSMREYEKRGALQLNVAKDLPTATAFMVKLQELHQKYWQAKDQPGAFSTEWVRGFHDTLLATRFKNGEIQMIEVSCGDEPITYLYNFVHNGKVYCYQSGLERGGNAHLKPGLVAHALAVQHNLDAGMKSYDFLMGNERYKKNLGNMRSDMYWLSLRRPLLRYRVHDSLAALKNWIRGRLGAAR